MSYVSMFVSFYLLFAIFDFSIKVASFAMERVLLTWNVFSLAPEVQ